jgi:translocation and assembly module TamA
VGLVDKTRDALVSSNLFSTIRVAPVPQPDVTGAVPMQLDLLERPPRSVSAGASYASNEGVSANVSWEHRNLLGEGEDLRLSAIYGQEDKGFGVDYREPDRVGDGWDLVSRAAFEDEHAIAYTSHRERIFGGFEYTGFRQLAVGIGLQLEHGIIDDYDLQQHYTLVGVPLTLRRDTTDDLLNPTVGDREDVALTPYVDPIRPSLHFLSSKVKGSIYQKLGDDDGFVLAGIAAIGSTVGVGLADLPKDKRWYAGGGGSVRGYGYQLAGPLGSHEEPVGGLSSFEASIELRYKVTQTIGVVPFVDAGNVYDSDFPDFGRRLFIGAGMGVRYFTALGPLRLDLATPLHARNVDRPIQIYVSIGQAF